MKKGINKTQIVNTTTSSKIQKFRIDTNKKSNKNDSEIHDMIDHYSTIDTQTVINVSVLNAENSNGYVLRSCFFQNIPGCPLWLNHCIQFNFEYMKIRIK